MKISIVTISYNQAAYLRECIDSVLSQEDVNLEYIVVDPGSTDGSREIIESYGDNIIKVLEADEGPADGLNKGFAKATGQIFGFINADDYFLKNSLRTISKVFSENTDRKFISGSGLQLRNGRMTRIRPTLLTTNTLLYRSAAIFQQGTFFKRELFEKCNGFNIDNRTCWDYELYLSMCFSGFRHYLIDADLAVFRVHESSITGSGRVIVQYNDDLNRIFESYKNRKWNILDSILSRFIRLYRFAIG